MNLRSVLFLSQCVAKDMVERGEGGVIVNVSSQASIRTLPEHTVYCEWREEGEGFIVMVETGAEVSLFQGQNCTLVQVNGKLSDLK